MRFQNVAAPDGRMRATADDQADAGLTHAKVDLDALHSYLTLPSRMSRVRIPSPAPFPSSNMDDRATGGSVVCRTHHLARLLGHRRTDAPRHGTSRPTSREAARVPVGNAATWAPREVSARGWVNTQFVYSSSSTAIVSAFSGSNTTVIASRCDRLGVRSTSKTRSFRCSANVSNTLLNRPSLVASSNLLVSS